MACVSVTALYRTLSRKFATTRLFCRAMLCKRDVAVVRCLCVGVSVTFVHCVKTNKHIFNFFHRRVATENSSFSIPNGMAIFRREPPNGGVECKWGRLKSRNLHRNLYFALCSLLLFTAGVLDDQARSTRFCVQRESDHQARSRATHSHGGRESCV